MIEPTAPRLASMPSGSMRFMDWSSLQFHLIRVYEGPIFEHARKGLYTSDKVSCWLVRKGRVELTTGRNRVVAKPGEWAFVASPTRMQSFTADAEILSVYFHFAWPNDEPLFTRPENQVFSAARFPLLEKSAMKLLQLMRRHVPKVDANIQFERCSLDVYLRSQALFPDWVRAYVDTMLQLNHAPQRLLGLDERALQLVRELDCHPLAKPFDEARFAKSTGLSAPHLAGLFLHDYGTTPRRYLDHRRREAARHAMEHTSASVKAVAFSLGFRYESHFCAWFKQAERCTPSEFRQKARSASSVQNFVPTLKRTVRGSA